MFVTVWMRVERWSPVPLVIVPGPANSAQFEDGPARRFLTVRPTVSDAVERVVGWQGRVGGSALTAGPGVSPR